MSHEDLMHLRGINIEMPPTPGIFAVDNGGDHGPCQVLCQVFPILTCGGENGRDRALKIADALNKTWSSCFEENKKNDKSGK